MVCEACIAITFGIKYDSGLSASDTCVELGHRLQLRISSRQRQCPYKSSAVTQSAAHGCTSLMASCGRPLLWTLQVCLPCRSMPDNGFLPLGKACCTHNGRMMLHLHAAFACRRIVCMQVTSGDSQKEKQTECMNGNSTIIDRAPVMIMPLQSTSQSLLAANALCWSMQNNLAADLGPVLVQAERLAIDLAGRDSTLGTSCAQLIQPQHHPSSHPWSGNSQWHCGTPSCWRRHQYRQQPQLPHWQRSLSSSTIWHCSPTTGQLAQSGQLTATSTRRAAPDSRPSSCCACCCAHCTALTL